VAQGEGSAETVADVPIDGGLQGDDDDGDNDDDNDDDDDVLSSPSSFACMRITVSTGEEQGTERSTSVCKSSATVVWIWFLLWLGGTLLEVSTFK
jgi:hypothetical protein